jgi:hypothetical protein
MAGPQAVFNRICLPFFTRFVGTYDAERLTPLPTLKFVLGRAKVVLDCDRILVSTDLTSENLYHSRRKFLDVSNSNADAMLSAAPSPQSTAMITC